MSKVITDDDPFVVQLSRKKSKNHSHQGTNSSEKQLTRDDLVMTNFHGEFEHLKNFIGPSFLLCIYFFIIGGMFGFFYGIFRGARDMSLKNTPKRLIATSILNTVGKQTTRFANGGASLCLLYSLNRRTINFLFDDDMQNLSPAQKQAIYGFTSGLIYKSTRGLYPALLSATLLASFCSSMVYLYDKKIISLKVY